MRIPKRIMDGLAIAALALGGVLGGSCALPAGPPSPNGDENLAWKPNLPGPQPEDFAGAEACKECHHALQATQITTDMANASMRPSASSILRQHPTLSLEQGPYSYSIQTVGPQVIFSVSDAHGQINAPLAESLLNLLSKHALGAYVGQSNLGDLVAGGLDDLDFHLMAAFLQQRGNMVRLPEGQLGSPGPNSELCH